VKPPKAQLPTAAGLAAALSLAEEQVPTAMLGGVSMAIRTMSAQRPGLHQALKAWRFAYWARRLYPSSAASRRMAVATGNRLLMEVSNVRKATSSPELAEALTRDLEHLTAVVRSLEPGWIPSHLPSGPSALPTPTLTALARLEQAALAGRVGGPALKDAFRGWREACTSYALTGTDATGKPMSVAAAGRELSDAIASALGGRPAKAQGFNSPSTYRRTIETAVDALERGQPSENARVVFLQIEQALKKDLEDPAVGSLVRRHLLPAAAQSPHSWDKLGNVIAGLQPVKATDAPAVDALVSRVKGVLGEMVAVSVPAYRAAYEQALQHADYLVATLNHRALRARRTPSYRAVLPQFDLKAPGPTGTGTKLYFDDAILVVDDATSEAFVVFAAQVKAGDASTAGAVSQMVNDQRRLLTGSVTINEVRYTLVPPPDVASVMRVFVGTRVPPGMASVSGRIQLVTGPVGGVDLARLALYLLKKTGKVQ
jgi:hypothetical protein